MSAVRPRWVLSVVACAAMLSTPILKAAADDWVMERTRNLAAVSGTYSNRQYGFRLTIPPGVSAWRTASPNPDHGLLIILGDHRTIDLDADYDAALYGSAAVLLGKRLRDVPKGRVEQAKIRLGDSPAERATVTGPIPSTVIAQWKALPPDNAINYSVILVTTNEAGARDRQALADILSTYRHMPPER